MIFTFTLQFLCINAIKITSGSVLINTSYDILCIPTVYGSPKLTSNALDMYYSDTVSAKLFLCTLQQQHYSFDLKKLVVKGISPVHHSHLPQKAPYTGISHLAGIPIHISVRLTRDHPP